MKTLKTFAAATATVALLATGAIAANPEVGGAPMFENKNIVENAVNSADHTTLVAAVKAAGLVDTLASEGPFTVFAPVNSAFDALPAGTVDTLLKPENKDMLTKVLTAHVVAGNWSAA
ncbi:MAG: fasciclin domain-containing protein, partial [Sulfitobacter sp.]